MDLQCCSKSVVAEIVNVSAFLLTPQWKREVDCQTRTPKITHKSYTQVCKRPLLFTVFFSQKIRCLSGVFVKILKASKTFRIDYPICVSYVKLCCVKQNICLVCLEQFRSYRMKAWQLSFKLLSVLLHWMWGELWKESLFIAYAKRERFALKFSRS